MCAEWVYAVWPLTFESELRLRSDAIPLGLDFLLLLLRGGCDRGRRGLSLLIRQMPRRRPRPQQRLSILKHSVLHGSLTAGRVELVGSVAETLPVVHDVRFGAPHWARNGRRAQLREAVLVVVHKIVIGRRQ